LKKKIDAVGDGRLEKRKVTTEVPATRNLFKEVKRKGRTCVGQ